MTSTLDQRFLLILRFLMAWTFIYAASHQAFDPSFSIVGFLNHTKTFRGFFSIFTGPEIAPVFSFLVAWGHLAIGLSLLSGCLVRLSAPIGAAILFLYWMAHMDFPFISDRNNFIVDYHIVYITVLLYLTAKNAGQYLGLDAWLKTLPALRQNTLLKPILG